MGVRISIMLILNSLTFFQFLQVSHQLFKGDPVAAGSLPDGFISHAVSAEAAHAVFGKNLLGCRILA